jgi:uncharacterized protein YtpQ (UPF0354 family)
VNYLLALVVSIAAICSIARAETFSAEAFTREFARALTIELPSSGVAVKGELRLSIKKAVGGEQTLFLNNAYKDYALDPARFGEIVKRFAAAIAQSEKPAAVLDRARIVPVIKDRQWLVDYRNTLKAQGYEQEPLAESYNNEIVIVYAHDEPKRMRYLMAQEDIGIERDKLREAAVENLRRILPKIEMGIVGDVSIISAGGDYDASLLLLDDIWSGGQIKVNGDIVVAIPARDVLLVTGSRSRNGLKAIRELAAKYVATEPHRLIDTLFVYRNGRFTKFGRT